MINETWRPVELCGRYFEYNRRLSPHVCAALSDHGATKTKSHAIMQLRRNREGLRQPLRAFRSLLGKVKKYIIVYRFRAHPSFSAASIFFCTENLSCFLGFFRQSFGPVPVVFRHLSSSFGILL